MSTSIKTNPKLWEVLKEQIKKKNDGKWNARLSQQLTLIYIKEMDKLGLKPFKGPKPKDNSLAKWTDEEWTYIKPGCKRYLPKKLVMKLTDDEKDLLCKNKKLGIKVAWPKEVKSKIVKFLNK